MIFHEKVVPMSIAIFDFSFFLTPNFWKNHRAANHQMWWKGAGDNLAQIHLTEHVLHCHYFHFLQNSTFSWNDLDLSSDTTTILRTWNFFRNGFLISSEEVWTCLRWNRQNKIGNYCELFILLICIFLISLHNGDKHETISLSLSTLVSRVSCDLGFGGSGELCKNGLDWQITTVWNLSDLFLFVEYSN